MLTPQALERATPTYRRGYRDGYNKKEKDATWSPGTFLHLDYNDGYDAGANDRRWDDERRNKKK
jgi:hypothetical protein